MLLQGTKHIAVLVATKRELTLIRLKLEVCICQKLHFEPACFKQGPNRHTRSSGKGVWDLVDAQTHLA